MTPPGTSSATSSGTVGLLHTVAGLASRFDADVDAALPGLRRIHVVDPWLLATAVQAGVTPDVESAVLAHVRYLESAGAAAVLVTCSSVGEAAEAADGQVAIPVLRVDAPMAHDAVALAARTGARGRVAVLATLASTLGPTGRLVERAAGAAAGTGVAVTVSSDVVRGAAAARDAGDDDAADALVARAVAAAAAGADVVVLAQASMARAAELARADVPVLTSPAGGVARLVRVLTADAQAAGSR